MGGERERLTDVVSHLLLRSLGESRVCAERDRTHNLGASCQLSNQLGYPAGAQQKGFKEI